MKDYIFTYHAKERIHRIGAYKSPEKNIEVAVRLLKKAKLVGKDKLNGRTYLKGGNFIFVLAGNVIVTVIEHKHTRVNLTRGALT